MKKINVEICTGTACFVMGSARLLKFAGELPENLQNKMDVKASLCCDLCRDWDESKPPIVRVGERIISGADEETILQALEKTLKGDL